MQYIELEKGVYQVGDILMREPKNYYDRYVTFESAGSIEYMNELYDFFEVKLLDENPEKVDNFTLVKKLELVRKVSLEEILSTDDLGEFSLCLAKLVKNDKDLLDKCLSQIFTLLKGHRDNSNDYCVYSMVDILGKFFEDHNVENFKQSDEIVTCLEEIELNNYWLLRFYHVLNGSYKDRIYSLLEKSVDSSELENYIESYDPYEYTY